MLVLAVHFATGLASIVAGTVAIAVRKGGTLHKSSGMIFTWAMLALGLTAAGIGAYERQPGQVFGGLLAAYLVYTGTTTVKPFPVIGARLDVALMILAFLLGAAMWYGAANEWLDPSMEVVGRPRVIPPLVAGTILILAVIGDFRTWRSGGLRGSRRLARHLWRMCFSLFVATGSFFLGQMKFIPEPVRIVPLLVVLAFAPIPVLLYWMWRVRLRARLHGLVIRSPEYIAPSLPRGR
jgi:uncharacterized membrane protein